MIKILSFQLMFFFIAVVGAMASPTAVVKDSNQKVQGILEENKKVLSAANEEITNIINGVTSFETMSKRAIEKFCRKLSESECNKFDSTFQKLLRLSSVSKLGRYRADRFDYTDEKIDGEKAVVTTVAYFSDDRIDLEYHLENISGKWMIVNYVADDIDTVRNYRRQFTRILKKEAFSELLERLQKKIAGYEKKEK